MALQPKSGLGLLRVRQTPLWASDQPVAEACTYAKQHKRQTSMPRAGFEPAVPEKKRPQTYAIKCYLSLIFSLKTLIKQGHSHYFLVLGV
jgi:hypothetical protein